MGQRENEDAVLDEGRTLKPVKLEGQLLALYEDADGNVVGEETFSVRIHAAQFGELPELARQAIEAHSAANA
jgi:hypothetical protein